MQSHSPVSEKSHTYVVVLYAYLWTRRGACLSMCVSMSVCVCVSMCLCLCVFMCVIRSGRYDLRLSPDGQKRAPLPTEKDEWRDICGRHGVLKSLLQSHAQPLRQCLVHRIERATSPELDESMRPCLDGLLCLSRLCCSLSLPAHGDCLLSMAWATGLLKLVPFAPLVGKTVSCCRTPHIVCLFCLRVLVRVCIFLPVCILVRVCISLSACLLSLCVCLSLSLKGSRHAAAVSNLVAFVETHVEHLGAAWTPFLVCLSELERLSLVRVKAGVLRASITAASGQGSISRQPPQLAAFNGLLPPLWSDLPASEYVWIVNAIGVMSGVL